VRRRWFFPGGSAGNEQLTAIVATLLLILLAVEGATLLRINSFMTVHVFVGMLLVPIVGLKLGSVAWRMFRYYLGGEEYVRRGPPHAVVRVLVAPVTVVSTITLFVTGILLVVLDQASGPIVGLHKASFVVWFGAMSVHVLTRLSRLQRPLTSRLGGTTLRLWLVLASVAAGFALATLSLPVADHLQDGVSARVRIDGG
jgi:hypothetical protein